MPVVLANTSDDAIVDMKTDGANVYWIDQSNVLSSVSVCGGPVTEIATVGGARMVGPTLALDTDNVFVAVDKYVWQVSKNGGCTLALASGQSAASGVAVSEGSVYWSGWNGLTSATINQVPVGGGPVTALAANLPLRPVNAAAGSSSYC
ncbi:MAG: hypothetical protein ACRENE_35570, partial [Polyangiaceae bacterium]